MAGTNDFKAFATDANANVTSQEEWETLTALKKGFSSGKASSAQVSKALRQPSTMAAVLGQFIANAELDALDDGDVDGLVAKLATALTTNLSLGTAATKNVGTGANQIPDMSSFSYSNGVYRFPNGMIIQLFAVTSLTTTAVTPFTFPVVFPSSCHGIFAAYNSGPAGNYYAFSDRTTEGANMRTFLGSPTPINGGGTASILAIGR
ncbi:hypothetical protein RHN94_16215 [Escherichia coli]|uniref:gp53-like domain-containing protein n=1 Tax=Escherichia coli TaxID=562 RepID=UPI0038732E0E